MRQEKA